MNNSIRKNEHCIIGLPSCDYVFNSSKSCFIGYGFNTSQLEVDIVKGILEANHIEPVEAKTMKTYAEHVFCQKICSKIIMSRFCIIFINNDQVQGASIPNANVNMEYGLMLGLNKHIIPFQKENDPLPFNISGLDTVKYDQSNFKELATLAITQAIEKTNEPEPDDSISDELIQYFLMSQGFVLADIDSPGDRELYKLAAPLKFAMAIDFAGVKYMYFGDFRTLSVDTILNRIEVFFKILGSKVVSLTFKRKIGVVADDPKVTILLGMFLKNLKVWIICKDSETKDHLEKEMANNKVIRPDLIGELRVYASSEISTNLI